MSSGAQRTEWHTDFSNADLTLQEQSEITAFHCRGYHRTTHVIEVFYTSVLYCDSFEVMLDARIQMTCDKEVTAMLLMAIFS